MDNIPDNQLVISVNDHTYVADRFYVDKCIKIGKQAMKGKNAIIATEKENIVILLNETHKSKEELYYSINEYEKNGFKVYTT